MKRVYLFLLISSMIAGKGNAQEIIAGSFNIRYDNPRDSGNLWKDRAPIAAAMIRFHDFDIVGTQEGLHHQLQDLQTNVPDFAYYGVGRDDGKTKGEHSAIFYRRSMFSVLDSGSFWLSATPEKPGPGWDARLNRICSWLKLKMKKGGKVLYAFNVHYDHEGVEARKESSQLMLQKIRQIAGKNPVVFTGDFNGGHQSEWYLLLRNSGFIKDAYQLAMERYVNNGTFNSFRTNNPSTEIIDHIFVTDQFNVKKYGVLTDTYHGKFPSDHFPVMVKLVFK
ncbi:MAG: endonuclease/exonuclease/phosphatase family protein [Chitinophagaceae bacterium]